MSTTTLGTSTGLQQTIIQSESSPSETLDAGHSVTDQKREESSSHGIVDGAADRFFAVVDSGLSLISGSAEAKMPAESASAASEKATQEDIPTPPKRDTFQSASDWMDEFAGSKTLDPVKTPVESVPSESNLVLNSESNPKQAELDQRLLALNPAGYEWEPTLHCALITPALSPEKADQIENPFARLPFSGAANLISSIHHLYEWPLQQIVSADEWLNIGVLGGDTKTVSEMQTARAELLDATVNLKEFARLERKDEGEQYAYEIENAKHDVSNAEVGLNPKQKAFDSLRSKTQYWSIAARLMEIAGASVAGVTANLSRFSNFQDMAASTVPNFKNLPESKQIEALTKAKGELATRLRLAPEIIAEGSFSALSTKAKTKLAAYETRRFWGQSGLPLALGVGLSATGIITEAKKGLEFIEKTTGMEPLSGETRETVKNLIYGGMFAGGALMLNANIKFPKLDVSFTSYRRIVSPAANVPAHAKETSMAGGMIFAAALMAETWYLHNVSAQQRVLPALYGMEPNSAYNPMNWDQDYLQTHTAAARSFGWGAFGFLWSASSKWQIDWADRLGVNVGKVDAALKNPNNKNLSRFGLPAAIGAATLGAQYLGILPTGSDLTHDVAKHYNLNGLKDLEGTSAETALDLGFVGLETGLFTWLTKKNLSKFAVTGADLAFTAAETAWVEQKSLVPQSARRSYARILKGKRPYYSILQGVAGLPIGIAIQQGMGYAQGFHSQEALTGTSMRSFATIPVNAATITYFNSSKGYATAWDGFSVNMPVFNYTWEQCSMQPEMVYQPAVMVADRYGHAEDEAKKAEYETQLATLYFISQEGTGERNRIKELMDKQGIDPQVVLAKAKAREELRKAL